MARAGAVCGPEPPPRCAVCVGESPIVLPPSVRLYTFPYELNTEPSKPKEFGMCAYGSYAHHTLYVYTEITVSIQ